MTKGRMVPTWGAFILTILAVFGGFIWASFYPASPYETMVWAVVTLAGAYFTKRVVDKKLTGPPGPCPPGGESDGQTK